jgi:hypothetical protein
MDNSGCMGRLGGIGGKVRVLVLGGLLFVTGASAASQLAPYAYAEELQRDGDLYRNWQKKVFDWFNSKIDRKVMREKIIAASEKCQKDTKIDLRIPREIALSHNDSDYGSRGTGEYWNGDISPDDVLIKMGRGFVLLLYRDLTKSNGVVRMELMTERYDETGAQKGGGYINQAYTEEWETSSAGYAAMVLGVPDEDIRSAFAKIAGNGQEVTIKTPQYGDIVMKLPAKNKYGDFAGVQIVFPGSVFKE